MEAQWTKWLAEFDGSSRKKARVEQWENLGMVTGCKQVLSDQEFCQAEECHRTDILSESLPFVTILTPTFKEASQDSDKQGIAQISFSTCQHSQIEFPILEAPLLLGNACMTSSSHCKPSPPWCNPQTTGFNSPAEWGHIFKPQSL